MKKKSNKSKSGDRFTYSSDIGLSVVKKGKEDSKSKSTKKNSDEK